MLSRLFSPIRSSLVRQPGALRRLLSTDSAVSLRIVTWPPGEKKTVPGGSQVSRIEPHDLFKAKRKFEAGSQSTEILGHSAAELKIDLEHPKLPIELKHLVLDYAVKTGIDPTQLSRVRGYLSLYPDHNQNVDKRVDFKGKATDALGPDTFAVLFPADIPQVNVTLQKFLGKRIPAINSCDFAGDIVMYGQADPKRDFMFVNGNFLDVFSCFTKCLQPTMVRGQSMIDSDGVLHISTATPNTHYFGLKMLAEYLMVQGLDPEQYEDPALCEHVCTTAVLSVLRELIGPEKYLEIAKRAIASDIKGLDGFPIVAFTHDVVGMTHEELKASVEPDTTNGVRP